METILFQKYQLKYQSDLLEEKRKQEKHKQHLQERKALYERQYIAANTGDSSENAPLDEAKKNLELLQEKLLAI